MTGVAIGMALAGLRPIHVHIRMDFLMLAMNQLVNIAAKTRYMYGGAGARAARRARDDRQELGPGRTALAGAALASSCTCPACGWWRRRRRHDAKGCLIAAIRDDNPVMFVEHRLLHSGSGPVPEESYEVPPGKARVLAPGRDVTLVGISYMRRRVPPRAHATRRRRHRRRSDRSDLAQPRSTSTPSSTPSRAPAACSSWTTAGPPAGPAPRSWRAGRSGCRACALRMQRLGFAPVTCPTTKNLEDLYYPNARRIAESVHLLARGSAPAMTPSSAALDTSTFRGPF